MDFGSKRASMCGAGRLLAVPLLWFFAFALPVCAQDQTISQMLHTSWTGRDGPPQGSLQSRRRPMEFYGSIASRVFLRSTA